MPPPPGQGFQVHVGPSDYANREPIYLLNPGDESTEFFYAFSGNDSDVYYFYRQYRQRPTTHHMSLVTQNEAGEMNARILGVANDSQDFPSGGILAPEDRGIGMPLAAATPITVAVHAVNPTSAPALREVWINFWYRDPSEVTQPALQWFHTGDTEFEIQPYQTTTLGPYGCEVHGDGRLLWLYGHRHANNVGFTITRVRGSERSLLYAAYDWREPLRLEYSSLIENPVPDREARKDGGHSGILELKTGDRIEWECEVVNTHGTPLRYTDQAFLGEMCVLDAEAVGSSCD